MICICLSFFLAALDRTIVGVAIPAISDEFNSFGDVSWYQAAFTLTNCVFQLPMGKFYKFFPAKWCTVVSIVVFELGSIVCAAAPSSVAFIIGRAITGIGAAGILVGAQVLIRDIFPLDKRPKYQGLLGATFGISAIMGPLVGGAFTTDVTWRWCFWISVPIGGVGLIGILILLPTSSASEKLQGSLLDKLFKFDPIGSFFLFPGVICLLLALQWGGIVYSWSDAKVIILLVLAVVLLSAFASAQLWVRENGTVPPRVISQRTVAAGIVVFLGIGATLVIVGIYLPIWYQAVQGLSAGSAGVKLLPYFLSTVVFTIASGIGTSKIGYYTPFLIVGTAILAVGTGLLTTFRTTTNSATSIGFQIVLGAGLGLSLQQPITAVQATLSNSDIPTGITVLTFAQTLGGTVFVSASQAILTRTLTKQLANALPGFNVSSITNTGATDIRNLVSKEQLPIVLQAFNDGIDNVFYCGLATALLAWVGSLFFEWKTVKKDMHQREDAV